MRHQHHRRPLRQQALDSGQGGANPRVIDDVLTVVERDVEVHPDQGAPACSVEIDDGLLGH